MTPDQAKAIEAIVACPNILKVLSENGRLFVKRLAAAPDRPLEAVEARYLVQMARKHKIGLDEPVGQAAEDAALPTSRETEADPEPSSPSSAAAVDSASDGGDAGLDPHPLANLFPMMSDRELDDLRESIRQNGQRQPIVLFEGRILDGRNRYVACREAEIEPQFRDFDPARDGAPLDFVLDHNLNRRHLSESQRAMVAARLATMRQGERTDLPSIEGRLTVSQAEAARHLGVGVASVERATVVHQRGSDELQEAVRQGRASVSAAAEIARLPEDEQRRILADVAASPETKRAFAGVVKALRREKQDAKKKARETREADLGARQRALPDKRYGVILADPEWQFEPFSRDTGMDRAADNHYPTTSTPDIVMRPVGEIAADDCALFLWATAPMLPAALQVMTGWGFAYKTHLIWRKAESHAAGLVIGTGYWFRNGHEILLLGTKGNPPAPAPGDQWPSMFDAAPLRHSAKPDNAYDLIEAYFPTLPKMELNARRARPGWDAWGLEAPE